MKPLSVKRKLEIEKSYEEFYYRLRLGRVSDPADDVKFRLSALIAFAPNRTDRQIYNHALINS